MFWKKQMMTKTLALTVSLFLIGALHTLIFGIFQYPSNFIIGEHHQHLTIYAKITFYASAISGAFSYPVFCRSIGVKNALIGGLFLNLMGLLILWINQYTGGIPLLIFLDMICFGFALTSVINALITFIILKFPNRTGAGITGLFAVLNGGIMMAPILLGVFKELQILDAIFPFLMLWTILAIWHVEKKVYEPPFPSHLQHLRKGTLIWKELHYRLALYFAAVAIYGASETNFSLWGFELVAQQFGEAAALEILPIFYLFLIVGQVMLLIPLYLYSPRKIFYGLVLLSAFSLYFFYHQKIPFGFIAGLALGGIGSSAIFPILISMMEKELLVTSEKKHLLPYIETGVSLLIGGYLAGNAFNDLWLAWLHLDNIEPHFNLSLGLAIIATVGLIGFGLSITAPRRGSSH